MIQQHDERVISYHTDNTTLLSLVGNCAICTADVHFSHIVWRGIDASHDTLIIALEEDGDEREDLDGDVELGCGQLLPYSQVRHVWKHDLV